MRRKYEEDTWIDPEEKAYPSGSINAGRKARAECPDGVTRIVHIGVADTFETIPAKVRVCGVAMKGYISVEGGVVNFNGGDWYAVMMKKAAKKAQKYWSEHPDEF